MGSLLGRVRSEVWLTVSLPQIVGPSFGGVVSASLMKELVLIPEQLE